MQMQATVLEEFGERSDLRKATDAMPVSLHTL